MDPEMVSGEAMNCHMCGNDTDFFCNDCGEPVCEDCCVAMTLQNQIDYTLCQECHDLYEAQDYEERHAEWKREEIIEAKKENYDFS